MTERRVVPQSVFARQLANPFLVPDFSAGSQNRGEARRLAGWELLGPLFRSFEEVGNGASTTMPLPDARDVNVPGALQLMKHQAEVVAAAADGHRTFLLADEPGLGKTAQALLAAEAADAFPMLAVVPNVVKTNWAREANIWVPHRMPTVIHGDGQDINGFADVVVVNYEVLDRHVGWLGDFGFRSMVVDEAHFIKNKTSQRSQNVLQLSERIRSRTGRPLFFALTGTPLINDIEDFRAIWQYLGWIDDKKPLGALMDALEETGLTPADHGFYPAARTSVVDQGIVRRRKVDVAKDIPARRIADMPVEIDDEIANSIREAEPSWSTSRRKVRVGTRRARTEGPRQRRRRRRAGAYRGDVRARAPTTATGENVFAMMRRIGQAKASSPPTTPHSSRATPARSSSSPSTSTSWTPPRRVRKKGIKHSSIRGDQTTGRADATIDSFVNDPDVHVIVCSLTAAGVGHQPAGRVQRRAGRAILDRCRADPGDRPGPPHRPGASRSRRGASSPRRPSTPGSPSSSTARRASLPARSTGPGRRDRPSTSSSRRW